MAETVELPGVGPVPKKEMAIGLGVVVVLVGVYYWRNHQSAPSTAAPAAAPADQYPPDGTTGNPSDPYSTDPATGQTYGDEATGSGGTFGAFPYDTSTSGDTGTTGTGVTGSNGPPFSTNSQWSNWAISQLQADNPAVRTGALTEALGLYLDGQPVTAAQKALIFDAQAVAGPPPVVGANGYPPDIRMSGSKGGTTHAANPVSGLHQSGSGKGTATITWDKSEHATGYKVSLSGGATRKDTTHATTWTFRGVRAGAHTASVLATPATAGARPATVSVEVK